MCKQNTSSFTTFVQTSLRRCIPKWKLNWIFPLIFAFSFSIVNRSHYGYQHKREECDHKRSPSNGWKTWKHLSDYGFPSLYLAVVYVPTFHFFPEDKLILHPVTMETYGSGIIRFTRYIPANMKSKQMDYFPSFAPRDSWLSWFTFNFKHCACLSLNLSAKTIVFSVLWTFRIKLQRVTLKLAKALIKKLTFALTSSLFEKTFWCVPVYATSLFIHSNRRCRDETGNIRLIIWSNEWRSVYLAFFILSTHYHSKPVEIFIRDIVRSFNRERTRIVDCLFTFTKSHHSSTKTSPDPSRLSSSTVTPFCVATLIDAVEKHSERWVFIRQQQTGRSWIALKNLGAFSIWIILRTFFLLPLEIIFFFNHKETHNLSSSILSFANNFASISLFDATSWIIDMVSGEICVETEATKSIITYRQLALTKETNNAVWSSTQKAWLRKCLTKTIVVELFT